MIPSSRKRITACALAFALTFTSTPHAYAAPFVKEALPVVQNRETVTAGLSEDYEKISDILKKSKTEIKDYSKDDVVKFIVELEGASLLDKKPEAKTMKQYLATGEGKAELKSIRSEQSSVKNQIQKMRSASIDIEYTYSVVLNGFAVEAPYSAYETLQQIPGVKSVTVSQAYDYVEPVNGYTEAVHTSGEMIDSDRVNAEGYTGKGTITAILDSGLDVEHEAFANAPEGAKWNADTVLSFVEAGNLQAKAAAADIYKSVKIPFAYDYADRDTEVLGPNEHGTHVAGSVGADCEEFTGVAPDTQLAVMKVFSDKSEGADDTWIFAALEDCVLIGVDTINMSLGSPSGFTTNELSDQVYNKVKDAGITLMCAAGNETDAVLNNNLGTNLPLVSEPDSGIVGAPSTYGAAVSVASVNENRIFAAYLLAADRHIRFNDSNAGAEKDFLAELDGQTLEYVAVPAFGDEASYANLDVEGKIALVSRGELDFTQKEANAAAAGAVAMIVFDNVEGALINMKTEGVIPTVFISKEDGKFLKNQENKQIAVSKDNQEYYTDDTCGLMSDFSSLGVAPDMSLKPEITAPGGNVYSTLPGSVYGNMSGTSMASPHMAGAASVVRQYVDQKFPELSETEAVTLINTLLMNTAVPVQDEYGVEYTPRKQGAGLAEIYNAIHTGAYVTVDGSERPKAELGDSANGYFSKSFTLTVHNISDTERTYELSAIPLAAKEETVEVYGESYQCISDHSRVLPEKEFQALFGSDTVTVPAGGTAQVEVRLRLTEEGEAALAAFTNGIYMDGFVVLKSQDEDGIDLSVPYLGFFGDWGASPVFDDSIYDEEEASVFESCMGLFDLVSGNGIYLGMNAFSEELITDADKIAVASKMLSTERVFSVLGLLRAPESLEYSITTTDGAKEYYHSKTDHVMKSFFYAGGGFVYYEMGPGYDGWAPIYEAEDGYYYVPDGDYLYNITAKVAGTDSAAGTQTVTFPISIDNEMPKLVDSRYEVVDGVPYLTLDVTDNQYLMGIQLISTDGESAYSAPKIIDEDEKGAVTSVTFDVSALQEAGLRTAKVTMIDYALNSVDSAEFSLVSQEMEPISVRINNRDITVTGSQVFEISATVAPDNAVDKSLTWTSSDDSVVSVEGTDRIDELGHQVAYITTHNVGGTALITATTVNGLSDYIEVFVNAEMNTFPEDYVIREDGYYKVPADLNREVKITENARNVILEGADENTADKPYQDLRFVSDITDGLNLTIRNLNVTTRSGNVIAFAGENNTLTISGENSIKGVDGTYMSKALVKAAKDVQLTVNGSGKLDLYVPNGYGAGIGADAGTDAGSITVDGAEINITNSSAGAGIGGGSNGSVQKVTVNDGKINIEIPLVSGGWSNNMVTSGAGIGTGDCAAASSRKAPVIEINGGEITGRSWTEAPVIGTSYTNTYTSSVGANITINGGKINAEVMQLQSDYAVTDGTAAIGVSNSVKGATSITINGGEVTAVSHGYGPAIGGGVNAVSGTIIVNGGTVTAVADSNDTSYPVPAIGVGRYGTAGIVQINKGSVKAVSANSDAIVSSFGYVINDDNDQVFESKLAAPNVKNVMVDGVDWKVSANHPDDENVYLWLPANTSAQTVVTETEEGNRNYEVIVDNKGMKSAKEFFRVTYELTNLTTDAAAKVYDGADLTGTLKASSVDGYSLPDSITVVSGGVEVQADYDAETGNFTVKAENITGAVVIKAEADVSSDKSALNALIGQVDGMNSDHYTEETWNALAEALENAKAVAADGKADQAKVDAAYSELLNAVNALNTRADLSELNAVIAEAEKLVSTEYMAEGWAEFEEALAAAKETAADANATQEDADAAKEALENAMNALTKRADKASLREAIDAAERLFKSDFTPESWENAALEEALENAIEVYTNPEATQDEVDEAEEALRTAIGKLTSVSDKTELFALIKAAKALSEEQYTAESWTALTAALAAAENTANDPDALQSEVNAAANALRQAIAELKLCADTEELEALIAEAEALEEGVYTPDSWNKVEKALEQAKAVVEDPNATQEAVDAAKEALQKAVDQLTERADKTELQKAYDKNKALAEVQYTVESWKAMDQALKEAKAVLDNPNAAQAQVDKALENLNNAYEALAEAGNASDLAKLIKEAEGKDLDGYTDKSAEKIEKALNDAKEVMKQRGTQYEIDAAYKALKNALNDAVKKPSGNNNGNNGNSNHNNNNSNGSSNSGNNNHSGSTVPRTGDDTAVMLYVVLFGMAALGMMFAARRKRSE